MSRVTRRAKRRWTRNAVSVGLALAARFAHAQTPATTASPSLPVVVRVVDPTGRVVPGADVAIVRGLNETRVSSTTDANGRAALALSDSQGDYQLVVRKIGYNRSDQFFHVDQASLTFEIVLHRTTQTLAPVRVTARQDLKRKSYFIDADEIAKHGDGLIDASDILKKLKPDMICGRSCSPGDAAGAATRAPVRRCPGFAFKQPRACPVDNTPPSIATNAWVNGVWIRTIPTDDAGCQAGRRGILAGLMAGTMQVLCEVQPEHIEQITYIDEFDNSVGKNHSNSSLFIVLKPGIGYQPGAKSYVLSDSAAASAIPLRRGARDSAASRDSIAPRESSVAVHDSVAALPVSAASADSADTMPAYRRRLLGVFDQETGDPIESAHVTDAKSGDYMRTSVTGTVTLAFLPVGSSEIVITKPGYEDLSLSVEIAPTATEPLTLLMKKKPPPR